MGETEVFREKPVSAPICPPQFPRGLLYPFLNHANCIYMGFVASYRLSVICMVNIEVQRGSVDEVVNMKFTLGVVRGAETSLSMVIISLFREICSDSGHFNYRLQFSAHNTNFTCLWTETGVESHITVEELIEFTALGFRISGITSVVSRAPK
jgi:hypothetical protein